MDLKEIIRRIGYFRNKCNLSARELSLRIGKNEAYINKLESFDFNLPTSVLLDIIDVCGITPQEFFYDNPQDYDSDKELITLFKNLSTEKKQNLIDFIKN